MPIALSVPFRGWGRDVGAEPSTDPSCLNYAHSLCPCPCCSQAQNSPTSAWHPPPRPLHWLVVAQPPLAPRSPGWSRLLSCTFLFPELLCHCSAHSRCVCLWDSPNDAPSFIKQGPHLDLQPRRDAEHTLRIQLLLIKSVTPSTHMRHSGNAARTLTFESKFLRENQVRTPN